MKQGDKIRFKAVVYNRDLQVERETDNILEGKILYAYDGNYTVQVVGKKQVYFVEKQFIIQ